MIRKGVGDGRGLAVDREAAGRSLLNLKDAERKAD